MVNDQRHLAAVPPGVTVVAMPAEVDLASATDANAAMLAAVALDVALVVVDFTQTILCATVGIRELVVAHRLARAFDIELRVVAPAKLMQIFRLTGLDCFLSFYPTLPAALAPS